MSSVRLEQIEEQIDDLIVSLRDVIETGKEVNKTTLIRGIIRNAALVISEQGFTKEIHSDFWNSAQRDFIADIIRAAADRHGLSMELLNSILKNLDDCLEILGFDSKLPQETILLRGLLKAKMSENEWISAVGSAGAARKLEELSIAEYDADNSRVRMNPLIADIVLERMKDWIE